MLNSLALDLFDFFPAFDLGKLWSRLKVTSQPTRPEDRQAQALRFYGVVLWPIKHTTEIRPDSLADEEVYITRDNNRAVCWNPKTDPSASTAHYYEKPAGELLQERVSQFLMRDNLGAASEAPITQKDRLNMLSDYFGEQKAQALLTNTLG